ncbi:HlyD family secretion protein [Xenorhabdus innexi]|uniref:RTX toxin transporter RtxD n=1 Tax=Xenorhabdus innexi TaxID=290109 RepID=A0A1N6MUG0_9GAMM|nr:HlyD family efflux transporter periplasmic adaptor subunit [Xenorhabdus innexi]PHM27390.1 RTX toxin transporter RtxD [Xenorhabdus innexi]SIP72505.1 conserved hypothetical protein [Xenorhabdus innexi]
MNYNSDLFRKEALKKKTIPLAGRVVLTSPFIFTVLTYLSSLFVIIIILFITFTEYSRKTSVKGQIYPKSGMSNIYAKENGVINDLKVKDGQFVSKGDILGSIYKGQHLKESTLQDSLKKQAVLKRDTLFKEINNMKHIHENKIKLLNENIDSLISQREQTKEQLAIQKKKLDELKKNTSRYKELETKRLITKEHMFSIERDELEQLEKINITKKEIIQISNLINEKKIEIEDAPLKQFVEIQEIERILTSVNQEILTIESQTETIIRANSSGFVSINNFEIGLHVDQSTLLLSITPRNQEIIAHLYIPNESIGFIKNGDIVNIKYSAYPYQKFGSFKAKIISISRTPMAIQEVKSIGLVLSSFKNTNDPVYLVKAQIENQHIEVNKDKKSIEIGMTLDADILHEKRKLYEWMFESIFTITDSI